MPKVPKEAPKENLKKKQALPKKQLNKPEVKTVKLDASGKILGRLATEVANILRGKDNPNFAPNIIVGSKVVITNAAKIKVTGDKMRSKMYYHHTGYIGHLKSESMADLYRKDPSEIIRRAVLGMLPKNKLQNIWMKNLQVFNGEENA